MRKQAEDAFRAETKLQPAMRSSIPARDCASPGWKRTRGRIELERADRLQPECRRHYSLAKPNRRRETMPQLKGLEARD